MGVALELVNKFHQIRVRDLIVQVPYRWCIISRPYLIHRLNRAFKMETFQTSLRFKLQIRRHQRTSLQILRVLPLSLLSWSQRLYLEVGRHSTIAGQDPSPLRARRDWALDVATLKKTRGIRKLGACWVLKMPVCLITLAAFYFVVFRAQRPCLQSLSEEGWDANTGTLVIHRSVSKWYDAGHVLTYL